jgi:hypothetical protein
MESNRKYILPKCSYCSKRFKCFTDEVANPSICDISRATTPMYSKAIKYCKACRVCLTCNRPMTEHEFERSMPHRSSCVECCMEEQVASWDTPVSHKWTHTIIYMNRAGETGRLDIHMSQEDAEDYYKYTKRRYCSGYAIYKLVKYNYQELPESN